LTLFFYFTTNGSPDFNVLDFLYGVTLKI